MLKSVMMFSLAVAAFSLMLVLVAGSGSLYVGLHEFSNPTNTKFNGACCGGGTSHFCTSECRLLFDISVIGFEQEETKSLLDIPILGSKVLSIPLSSQMRNPLSFSFKRWPGQVNIVVRIYDMHKDSSGLVDEFKFPFKHRTPNINYKNVTEYGTRPSKNTKLRMLLRYDCDIYFEENDCSVFCPPGISPCPIRKTGSTESTTDWTLLLTTTVPHPGKMCHTVGPLSAVKNLNINGSSENCTDNNTENSSSSTPAKFLTEAPTTNFAIPSSIETTLETTEVNVENVTEFSTNENTDILSVSSVRSTLQSTEVETVTDFSINMNNRTESESTTVDLMTTLISSQKMTPKTKTAKPSPILTTVTKLKQPSTKSSMGTSKRVHPTNRMGSLHTTPQMSTHHQTSSNIPNGGKTNNDDVMHYWPAIVGGVLGIMAIIAVLGAFIYVRKLKAQQKKTEDIYNVNPQTWILDTNENGTSGMSEIALETELV